MTWTVGPSSLSANMLMKQKLHKGKCKVLHLGRNKPMHQGRLRGSWTESSFAESTGPVAHELAMLSGSKRRAASGKASLAA